MKHFVFILLTTTLLFGWGKTGHRVIGKIAEENLSSKAIEEITSLMGHTDLARVSNWADEIKSDPKWDHSHDWHYCTILEGQAYRGPEDGGFAVQKVLEFTKLLKQDKLSEKDQKDVIRFIIHIVADLHQPMHVGDGSDKGGNDVKVSWFWDETNLHRVWDSHMIDHMQYSYTEYAQQIQLGLSDKEKQDMLDPDVMSFVNKSRSLRGETYEIGDGKLSWKYIYKNRGVMEDRLLKGGYHLAAILNDIYE